MREMGQSAWLSTSLYNLQGIEGQSQCDGDRNCHLWFAYSGKTLYSCRNFIVLDILNNRNTLSRTLKKTRLLTHLTQTPTSPVSLRLPRQPLRPRARLFQAGPQRAITYYCTKGVAGMTPTARVFPIPHFIFKGSLVDPRLRASNEHILIVRVPGAGGRSGTPPPFSAPAQIS